MAAAAFPLGQLFLWIIAAKGHYVDGPPLLEGGCSSKMQALLRRVPILHRPERTPLLLLFPTLQLAIFTVQQLFQELASRSRYAWKDEAVLVEIPMPVQGDVTEAENCLQDEDGNKEHTEDIKGKIEGMQRVIEGTRDQVVLSWLQRREELPADAPIVLIAPGLNCNKDSLPGTSPYEALLTRRCRVAVYHKRARAGLLQAPVFHLFGHPSDFQTALIHVAEKWPQAAIHVVAYSSGNGLVASHAARYAETMPATVRSILLLVGGAEYNVAFNPPRSNFMSRQLMDGLAHFTKERLLKVNAKLLKLANPEGFEAAMAATTMQGLYNTCMKHFSGYTGDAAPYAEACLNPLADGVRAFHRIKVPLLWVLTEDDPVMPGGAAADWRQTVQNMPLAALATFRRGSHCACYDSYALSRWADKLMVEWLDAQDQEPDCKADSSLQTAGSS